MFTFNDSKALKAVIFCHSIQKIRTFCINVFVDINWLKTKLVRIKEAIYLCFKQKILCVGACMCIRSISCK